MSALLHAASSSVAGFTWLPQSESWPSPESAVSLPVAPRSSWEVSGPHSHEARSGKRLRDPFAEARLWARGGAAPPSVLSIKIHPWSASGEAIFILSCTQFYENI